MTLLLKENMHILHLLQMQIQSHFVSIQRKLVRNQLLALANSIF